MRRYIAAWERAIQAHLSTQEWTMFVSRLHLTQEEQNLFRGLLRAMIKPQPSMSLEVVDSLSAWALGEVDAVRSMGKHLDRIRLHELQALANGLARSIAYQTDWAAAVEEAPVMEPDISEPDDRPTLVAPQPRATVPVPEGLSEELLAQCRPPKPAPLPVFTDHEAPTARGSDVAKAIADAQAASKDDDAEISYSHDFIELDIDEEPDS
ncbi:MAG: hypothetical protein WC551_00905 [Patescibacteria group bacterium]